MKYLVNQPRVPEEVYDTAVAAALHAAKITDRLTTVDSLRVQIESLQETDTLTVANGVSIIAIPETYHDIATAPAPSDVPVDVLTEVATIPVAEPSSTGAIPVDIIAEAAKTRRVKA